MPRWTLPGWKRGPGSSRERPRSTWGLQMRAWWRETPVNTASRIQSVAEPGSVYVGEATKRSTESAIAYADAGTYELKGKAQPVRVYRTLRVVAGVRGALRSEGLDAPFVGRDRELRLLKNVFHAAFDEGKAHLVSLVGIAGIGKSRLSWEFYKYVDGLADSFRWHRGRCLSYGDGVAYWALAEMVRGRADIVEGEDLTSAAAKLRAAVERYVPDPEERRWVEPRLSHLLGLEERAVREKEDLFAGWRLFFERMAEDRPVIMTFEDCQWADASLAGVHRLPVGVVALPPDLHSGPGPPRTPR